MWLKSVNDPQQGERCFPFHLDCGAALVGSLVGKIVRGGCDGERCLVDADEELLSSDGGDAPCERPCARHEAFAGERVERDGGQPSVMLNLVGDVHLREADDVQFNEVAPVLEQHIVVWRDDRVSEVASLNVFDPGDVVQ